jgi:hypothetical protein
VGLSHARFGCKMMMIMSFILFLGWVKGGQRGERVRDRRVRDGRMGGRVKGGSYLLQYLFMKYIFFLNK